MGLVGKQGWIDETVWYVAATGLFIGYVLLRKMSSAWRIPWMAVIAGCVIAAKASGLAAPESFVIDNFTHKSLVVSGVVLSQPHQTVKSLQVRLDNVEVEGVSAAWHGALQLTMPVHSQVVYGDRLQLKGSIKDLTAVEKGYRAYLENQHIYGVMVWPVMVGQASGYGNAVVGWGIANQENLVEVMQQLLPQDLSAFLLGIVLGSDQMLSEEFDLALKNTGTSHIVVASGYNIGILIVLCMSFSARFGRYWQIGCCVGAVVGFVLVSGLEPSLIRASFMAGLAMSSVLWGRQRQALHLLFIAGLAMLVINPWWLFDIGFQLSFMATLSLILFQPSIVKRLPNFLPDWLREIVSSTMAAQIMVYPILLVSFSKVSVVSLLTNVLVLWLIPWLMAGGVLVLLFSLIHQHLGQILSYIVYPWLWYVREIIVLTAQLPFASVTVGFNWFGVALLYVLTLVIYGRIHLDKYEQSP